MQKELKLNFPETPGGRLDLLFSDPIFPFHILKCKTGHISA